MTFRVRRSWLLLQASLNGFMLGGVTTVAGALVGGPRVSAAVGMITFLVGAMLAVPSIRRRHLVVDSSGLVAVRTSFQLRAGWDDIVRFDHSRFARVLPIVLLRLNDGAVITGLDGAPLDDRLLRRVRKAGADRGIQLSPYVQHLDEGAFADLLREHRPDLAERR